MNHCMHSALYGIRNRFAMLLACLLLIASTNAVNAATDDDAIRGPATIPLGSKLATINLPSGYVFIGKEKTKKVLEQQGSVGENALGMIVPEKDPNSFWMLCRYEDCGYVKDDDAEKLNADEILQTYKDGVAGQNEDRKRLNLPPMYIAGWAEKPHYDKAQHHVVWAIGGKDKEDADAPVTDVNYNTRILGRRGVLSLNLITAPQTLSTYKPNAAQLLTATTFDKGEAYADYRPGKDKTAGFGIAGLVLGGGAMAAAAKLGLLGGLWKWILATVLILKKFIIVAVVAGGAALSKLFKRAPKSPE
jgi:uncharacterized membrane-anchored protein